MKLGPALLILLTGLCTSATAQSKIQPIKFSDTRLSNGLRVIIVEDHYAPVYAIAVSYKVGSKDERDGRTGFAHLFEHMMFKGSENVGAGEHFFLIFNYGGNMNGTTNTDRTVYYEVLPKNQLDLGLFLESDRMRSLAVTQENLDNQRQAVQEERRLRLDDQAYGKAQERFDEIAFDNFAYHHSVIGSMADLNAASVSDVQDFFRTYYAPNNAVVALVGDLDTKATLAKVDKYFGNIPRQDPPKRVDLTEPEMKGERRETVEDKLARADQLTIAYKIPPATSADLPALSALGSIFGGGESSRLYQKLVKGEESVIQLFGFTDERRGPSSIFVGAIPKPEKDLSKIRETIMTEIKDLAAHGPTCEEMEKIENQLINDAVRMRQSSMSRAQSIAEYALYDGDPTIVNSELEELLAVTPEQIRHAVGTFLNTDNRALLDVVPAGKAAGA